jgi:hypothetical protein
MKRFPVVFLTVIFLILVTATLAGCTQAPVQAPVTQAPTAAPVTTAEIPLIPVTATVTPTPTVIQTQSPDSPIIVKNVVVTPRGEILAGTPVKVSFDIKFNPTGSETFPSLRTLALVTDIQNAEWSYNTAIDGNPSTAINATEKNLYISGWVLSYPSKKELSMHVNVTGTFPSSPKSGSIKVIRVNIQDDTGAIIPGTDYINTKSYSENTTLNSPPASSSLPDATPEPSAYTGNGDDIRPFTIKEGGGFIITGVYSGDTNFVVRITDNDGKQVGSSLFNQTGPYTGKKIVNLAPGKYFFEIQGKGPWSIDLSRT